MTGLTAAPSRLRVEHLSEALGLTVRAPRLSWLLPSGARRQLAFRVRAGRWDSGRVVSEQSLLVPYRGPRLRSGERVGWTVKVWSDRGESEWAQPAWWEMGPLERGDWTARWIGPQERLAPDAVRLLRGAVVLDRPVARARLHATAYGLYELFVNGRRVGDVELTPGFTSYDAQLQVQTFDVTELLRAGVNVLGAVLSGGWLKWTRLYRDLDIGLLAQLNVTTADGAEQRFGTGPDWTAGSGSILSADLQRGQVVDLRAEPLGWATPGFHGDEWRAVTLQDRDMSRLTASPAPPVRRVQELRPVAVTRPRPDRQVVDLGQNINGWTRMARLGPAGTTVTLTHGETLDAQGDVTVDHIAPNGARGFQTDRVMSSGGGTPFEPRHATRGFRYVRIEGHPEELTADDVTGVVVHTDMRRTGWFECSDDRINRLHEAAVWSFRGNACDIPTDCPTRERMGWTGDWQLFVETAAFLYDVAGFSAKWLGDLAADQCAEGIVWHCAPNTEHPEFYSAFPPGSAGWGDAAVIVPWQIYQAYGDRDLLERQWPSMTAWVEYAAGRARDHRHPQRAAERPAPAPYERYLWDTGFHWGEWLEPGAQPAEAGGAAALLEQLRSADHGIVATAYLHHSALLLSRIALVLGRHLAARQYRHLATAARAAWQTEYLRPDGMLTSPTQANLVRALAFHLVPRAQRHRVAARLREEIRAADTHLATGFLATPYLLPTLADTGHLAVAYELLLQDSEPSWLAMLERGATTMWELWNGIDERGTPHDSLNHYSKGAVVSFLHRHVAGIRLLDDAPAYRRFEVRPLPGGALTWARALHDAPYGRIEATWRIAGDELVVEVTVPPGTSADVHLPDGRRFRAEPGSARYIGEAPAASNAKPAR